MIIHQLPHPPPPTNPTFPCVMALERFMGFSSASQASENSSKDPSGLLVQPGSSPLEAPQRSPPGRLPLIPRGPVWPLNFNSCVRGGGGGGQQLEAAALSPGSQWPSLDNKLAAVSRLQPCGQGPGVGAVLTSRATANGLCSMWVSCFPPGSKPLRSAKKSLLSTYCVPGTC